MHVLVMEFLGKDGVAAPRLKDAGLPPARMRQAYTGELRLSVRAGGRATTLCAASFMGAPVAGR